MSAAHKPSAPGRIARATAATVLIVLTCVLVPVALITVWIHDIALDTDRYVKTVAPLATEPAIQDAAVDRISEAVDVRIDGDQAAAELADWLRSQGLPPRATAAVRGLGPQIDSAVDGAVTKVVTRIVHSDAFATTWEKANERAHNAVVHALTGEGRGAVGVEGGTVTLDVGDVVEQVKQQLVDAGLSPAEKIPQVDKQLVLFQSEELEKIREGADLLDEAGYWLPVLTVVIGAAGVLVARRRRRALARTALGAAFACLVVVIALVVVRRFYLDHLPAAVQSDAAAAAVFDTLLRFLRYALVTTIVLGVVVALGAYLIGPGRLPVAIRRACDRTADSAAGWAYGHEIRAGRVGVWAQAHRRSIALSALAILAFVFAVWNRPTALTILVFALVLLAVLAVLALLAAGGRAEERAQPTRAG
ncbi:hypothetical protein [Streptomyces cyaneus]|uniref:hypothetical protein n=1 Tax=Streptomyces cyaneus TaxID=1904 RepID=UPI000FF8B1DD|nr:hypothetical protein [Streptomyces cyaneus]